MSTFNWCLGPLILFCFSEDLGTWSCIRSFLHHTGSITSLVLCPGAERFVSSGNDGNVCIWSFTEEEPAHIIRLKDEIASCFEFFISSGV